MNLNQVRKVFKSIDSSGWVYRVAYGIPIGIVRLLGIVQVEHLRQLQVLRDEEHPGYDVAIVMADDETLSDFVAAPQLEYPQIHITTSLGRANSYARPIP
jgi:hypothetical protein